MPFRFHKSFNLGKALKLNLNKRSVSVTMGSGRSHTTVNSNGQRTESVRIADGLSWRKTTNKRKK